MQCPSCATENSGKAKFCAECGAALGVPCPHCAFRNARDAAVCGVCGRSLDSARPPTAERRQLTVFFADVAGSTKLAEVLDPEDLRDLYARYQNLCAETLHRYEGHLAQYLGDGILGYFGYPAAHEDDAARAVLAGLEILDRIGQLGGNRLRVRVGIHTGLVVVGDVGGGARREQLALGEAPNIAARIQAEALPDTLVISDATRELVAGQFALESLGSRTLKGLSRPIQIFQVLGRSGAATRFQAMATARGLTPLVGRERELETIHRAWKDAAAGQGRTILLRGPAGMGKSRLLEAARQSAADSLHEIFEAECSPYHVNSPLHPILEMLERRSGIESNLTPNDKLDLLEQFAAGRGVPPDEATVALAELFSIPTSGRYRDPEIPAARRRQWTIELVARLLLRSVGGSPVLLLIEDLHWADPSTLDLLSAMLARQNSFAILIVCTARPEFSPPWRAIESYREIPVDSLAPDETRALIARVAGQKPLPQVVREELVARTGGVPLFVEAMTRTVIEAGILRELPDRYELTGALPPTLIPATVHDSLMGRIDRLGADRPVAQLAATIGRESSFRLLHAVLESPAEELIAALRHLTDLELVSENGVPPDSTYTFRHALIQDAAYESLLRKTRQDFHSRIAEVLPSRFPDLARNRPELMARHFEGAGRITEAIAGWMKAGHLAQQRSASRECAAYLRKAILLLETLPPDDRGRLEQEMEAQLALSSALMATLGWAAPEVELACQRTRELCERLGNNNGLLTALWGLWSVYLLRGDVPKAVETAKAVLEMALASGDPGLQIAACQANCSSNYFLARFAESVEHGKSGLALYQPDLERGLAAAFQLPLSAACGNFMALSLWLLGYPDQADQAIRRSLQILEALDMPACTVYGLSCSNIFFYMKRDVAEVARRAERIYPLALNEGHLFWMNWARVYRGWAQAMTGDAKAAVIEMVDAIETLEQSGSNLGLIQGYLMLAEAWWRAGRPDEALAAIPRGLRRSHEHQEKIPEPDLHRMRGEILISCGEITDGEASLRCAIETAQAQKAKMLELRGAVSLARFWRDRDRFDEARALVEPLYDWFHEGFDTPDLIAARTLLASLARSVHHA